MNGDWLTILALALSGASVIVTGLMLRDRHRHGSGFEE